MTDYNPHDPTTYIADDLQPLVRSIDDAHPSKTNAMVHTHADLSAIADSLREFRQRSPIVVLTSTGEILAGTGRWLSAKNLLGWTHIAMVFTDDEPDMAQRYNIADNATGRISEFNFDLLRNVIDETSPVPGITNDFMARVKATSSPSSNKKREKPDKDPWPKIKVTVPPDLFEQYERMMKHAEGDSEWQRFGNLIGAVV